MENSQSHFPISWFFFFFPPCWKSHPASIFFFFKFFNLFLISLFNISFPRHSNPGPKDPVPPHPLGISGSSLTGKTPGIPLEAAWILWIRLRGKQGLDFGIFQLLKSRQTQVCPNCCFFWVLRPQKSKNIPENWEKRIWDELWLKFPAGRGGGKCRV